VSELAELIRDATGYLGGLIFESRAALKEKLDRVRRE
jgi:hypothetical protein